jgi:hypothetical protein
MLPEKWLSLDEVENAIDNLEMCRHFLTAIESELRWKWTVIAWHQALYGFAISAVQGMDQLSVLVDPGNHESKLISIHEALRRCKDSSLLWPGATPLVTTPDEDHALERLIQEFRNSFVHFRAISWSIETSGMPALLKHGFRVVRGIALDSQSVRYYDSDREDRVRAALNGIGHELQSRAV